MVPDSFVVIVTNKSCVFDSWLGGDYDLSLTVLELVLLNGCFAVPASNGLSELEDK